MAQIRIPANPIERVGDIVHTAGHLGINQEQFTSLIHDSNRNKTAEPLRGAARLALTSRFHITSASLEEFVSQRALDGEVVASESIPSELLSSQDEKELFYRQSIIPVLGSLGTTYVRLARVDALFHGRA